MSASTDASGLLASNSASALRVLHVHSGNLYGGVESMLLTQAQQQALCPQLQQSFALCFTGRLSEELTTAGAVVHWLGKVRIRQPFSILRVRRNLKTLLRRNAFDVIVTHSSWAQVIFGPVSRIAGVPLVFHMHGPASGEGWLERWAQKTRPDAVVCNSHFTATTVARLFPEVRTEIVYCPVAPPESNQSEASRKETRHELRTPYDATVIIQVSRMESWKGQVQHLEALARLKDLPGWVSWQVGGAQRIGEKMYLERLREIATRLGIADRVRFLDQRRDVPRLLAAADIFCQPNAGPEAFGLAFIEALYAQLPVVTTDIGAAREIVDAGCGVLVPVGDANSLAMALRGLIQEPSLRTELGAAGPQRARSLCDPVTQMPQLHKALGSVVGQGRATISEGHS